MIPRMFSVSKSVMNLGSGVLNETADPSQLNISVPGVPESSFFSNGQIHISFKGSRNARKNISLPIAININKEPWKSNDVQSCTYVERSKMDVDMVKSLYLNLDANAVSFIPNCSHLSSNILNPNAHAFLPHKMVNDNCAISNICSSVMQPKLNFASFMSMPASSSLNVYATPYIPLGFRLSPSVSSTVNTAFMNTCFILSVFLLNEIMTVDISPKDTLKNIKLNNANKIVFGHFNRNLNA